MKTLQELNQANKRFHDRKDSSDIVEAARKALEQETETASKALQGFPRGPMGLTPESVRQSSEFRQAKTKYERAFQALRNFNQQNPSRPRR